MEKRLNLRFNLNREDDRTAWEYLRSYGGSMNKAAIRAICEQAKCEQQTEDENHFLDCVIDAVRAEIRMAPMLSLSQILQPQPAPQPELNTQQSESEEALFDFLDQF